jgi:hypothetical protein
MQVVSSQKKHNFLGNIFVLTSMGVGVYVAVYLFFCHAKLFLTFSFFCHAKLS